jgi:hypothetical protein
LTIAMIAPASTQTQMATCIQIQSGDMRPKLVDSSEGRASIAAVTPDPPSPADRAAAVLRAAEAAAAAGHEPAPAAPERPSVPQAAGAADRLLVAADDLAADVDDAREHLDALNDALGRLIR